MNRQCLKRSLFNVQNHQWILSSASSDSTHLAAADITSETTEAVGGVVFRILRDNGFNASGIYTNCTPILHLALRSIYPPPGEPLVQCHRLHKEQAPYA